MHETLTPSPFTSDAPDGIVAVALRASAWAGEPFLQEDDDPAIVLAPGTALRRALDAAAAEMEAGHSEPSSEWKVRYALMLGLERVLSEKPPRLASGTELRRHQVDALAGMLTELIAANQKNLENGNGSLNGSVQLDDIIDEDEDDEDFEPENGEDDDEPVAELSPSEDPGRRAPLPLPPSDGVGQDDRRGRVRRSGAHRRRADPHAPSAPRRSVPPRADRPRLRQPDHTT